MTTKATRDVIDLKVRPISAANGDGIKIDGDCGSDFAIDGVPIGLSVPCDARFLSLIVDTGIQILEFTGLGVNFVRDQAHGLSQNTTGGVFVVRSGNEAEEHLLGLTVSLQQTSGFVRVRTHTKFAVGTGIDLAVAFQSHGFITHFHLDHIICGCPLGGIRNRPFLGDPFLDPGTIVGQDAQ